MKKIFLALAVTSLFVSMSYSSESCKSMAQKDDAKFSKARIKSFQCEHTWKEGKKKLKEERAFEVVFLTQYCMKYEGGNPTDCLIARTCDARGAKFSDYGPSLVLTEEMKETLCAEDKYFLFGLEGMKGPKAWIECKAGKIQKIVISDPQGGKLSCNMPAF